MHIARDDIPMVVAMAEFYSAHEASYWPEQLERDIREFESVVGEEFRKERKRVEQ